MAGNTHIGTRVRSATVPDSRSEEEAMLIHCDRRATTKTGAVPPEGWYQYGCYLPLGQLPFGALDDIALVKLPLNIEHEIILGAVPVGRDQ